MKLNTDEFDDNQGTSSSSNHVERSTSQSRSCQIWDQVHLSRLFGAPPSKLGENPHARRQAKREQQLKEQAKISVSLGFKGLGLSQNLLDYLESKQIFTPTEVQQTIIQSMLVNPQKSFYIGASTGSGKTLAYLLPLIELIKQKEKEIGIAKGASLSMRPAAIVVCPSKELVHQVESVAKEISHFHKIRVMKLSNDQEFKEERERLAEGVDIVVTTLSRLEAHIQGKSLFTSQLHTMIFDEADALLDSGNQEAMSFFMRVVVNPEVIQNRGFAARAIFVSATLGGSLKSFLRTVFGNTDSPSFSKVITQGTHFNLAHIRHDFKHVKEFDKHAALEEEIKPIIKTLIKKKHGAMVFCDSVKSAQSTEYFINQLGFKTVSLHGSVPAKMRLQHYEAFKRGDVPFLVATDLGARGLDFSHVSHVINFDFPKCAGDYLHRVGRTGRAGKTGYAVSLYRNSDLPLVNKLKDSYEQGIPLILEDGHKSAYALDNKELLKRSSGNSNSQRAIEARDAIEKKRALTSSSGGTIVEDDDQYKPANKRLVMNAKKPPQSKLLKVYRKLKGEIRDIPKGRRHQEQKRVKLITKRLRGVRRDALKERNYLARKGLVKAKIIEGADRVNQKAKKVKAKQVDLRANRGKSSIKATKK
jgi:superfamily II DNA/RNA helicase